MPSISHLPENSGISSARLISVLVPDRPLMEKNISFPQMMRESSSRKTTIGNGKLSSVLFFAVSASYVTDSIYASSAFLLRERMISE